MELIDLLSWLCIIVTVGSFSAGIPPCRQMLQHGTTRNIPFMPFINGAVINIAIFFYGYLKEDFTVIVVNSIGSVLHIFYVFLYNVYSHQKEDTYKKTVLGLAVLFTLYIYLQMIVIEREAIITTLGTFTLVLLMAGNISPLLSLIPSLTGAASSLIQIAFVLMYSTHQGNWRKRLPRSSRFLKNVLQTMQL